METIVIGGGPAGMLAAYGASKNGDKVTILEKMNSIRKKVIDYW
jgi:predicted flavoprotein YhiN